MLHVFLVDIGVMLKFDMRMAAESVARLMEAVNQKVFIPPNKQVLLSANGEPLAPSNRVASYASCGTETQPIYLFSKSTIESNAPPSPSVNFGSESWLKEEVEKCLKMRTKYETLVARANLAAEFQRLSVEITEDCENVINDQVSQGNGWRAVVLNLNHITSAFEHHVNVFEEYYRNFLLSRLQYTQMIQRYEHVLKLLKQLPLLKCLHRGEAEMQSVNLLQWISSHDKQSSIENLVKQCQEALEKCNEAALEEIVHDAHEVLDSVHNVRIQEIEGLPEVLLRLQQKLQLARQWAQDQLDMAQGFQKNQQRAEHVRDVSVLPDLCASHKKQLFVLLKNHNRIREVQSICSHAKNDLTANIHKRLRWVMEKQNLIFDCDSKLIIYHESLKRIKKRLDIFEQVFEAPKMYVLAVLEVLRRKNFSAQFHEWARSVSDSAISTRTEELDKRESFHQVFANHFVKNLFPGLDKLPPPFAEEPIDLYRDELPDISVEDIRLLQDTVPELMSELHIGDPLETSTIVRDCLSQSNLTKLVDPRQNKTLEETMSLRQKIAVDNKQLTVSVVKREISSNDVTDFPFPAGVRDLTRVRTKASKNDRLELVGDHELDDMHDNDDEEFIETAFEPASLQSLSRDKLMNTSNDSDALYHSAELDFSRTSPITSSPPSIISSPPSTKSSSSPIAIKGSARSIARFESHSLSPEAQRVLKEEVLSLPILTTTQQSAECTASPRDEKNSSQNSCVSLSDAIKAVEVNERLTTTDLLQTMQRDAKQLKERFAGFVQETLSMQESNRDDFKDAKTSILQACQLQGNELQRVSDELCRCKQFSEELESNHTTALQDLREKNEKERHRLEGELEHLQTTHASGCDDMERKHSDVISKLRGELSQAVAEKRVLTTQCEQLEKKCVTLDKELNDSKKQYDEHAETCKTETDELHNEIDELQQNTSQLQKRIEIEEAERNDLNNKNKQLAEELSDIRQQLDSISLQNQSMAHQLDLSRAENQSIASQLESTRTHNKSIEVQLEQLANSSQQSIDEHLSHVSSVTVQHKELKRLLTEKEQELTQALQMKDTLEAHKQNNFNAVFNKIRKEKDEQIRKMTNTIGALEKELGNQRGRNDALNTEIGVHKEAFSTLESDMKKAQDNFESIKTELLQENARLKGDVDSLNQTIEQMNIKQLEAIEELKIQYEEDLKTLKESSELQKETTLEEYGKSEHALKLLSSSSIEEGLDMLEIDHLLEKNKNLEAENERLKSIVSRDVAVTSSPKAQKVVRTTDSKPVEKFALRDLDIGSLVLLCFDDVIHQYVALTLTSDKHFLHPDSLKDISIGRASDRRQWMFAFITDKELCVAKKPNNKFQLPVNTYFSRIHVRLYDNNK